MHHKINYLLLAFLFFATHANAQVNLNAGLVAYYPFNGNFSDQSGNGNNGVGQNGASFGADQWGNANSAAFFDGIDDWVNIAPSASISPSKQFTISFRFKTNDADHGPDGQVLFSKADYTINPNNYQYHIGINYPPFGINGLWVGTRHQGNCSSTTFLSDDYLIDPDTIISNQWYCVSFVFDQGVKSLYINGILALQQTVSVGLFPNQTDSCTAGSLRFGTWWAGDTDYFYGLMDEVRIYNRPLNTAEIDSLCNYAPLVVQCPTIQNLPDTLKACENSTIQLNPSLSGLNGTAFDTIWTPSGGLSDSSIINPIVTVGSSPVLYKVSVVSVKSANIVVNGDFSAGNSGFTSGYVAGTGGTWGPCSNAGTYGVSNDPVNLHNLWTSFSDHTTGTGQMMGVNGASTAGVSVWCQTVNILPNTYYDFSIWLANVAASSPAALQFTINGNPIGNIFNAPNIAGQWAQFHHVWYSGINTTATICITNQNTMGTGNDFVLDDIEFKEVCVTEDSVYVVPALTQADFTISSNPVCIGQPVTFTANPAGYPNLSYSWNLGDGNSASGNPVVHSYANYGSYAVTLYFADSTGCKDTVSHTVSVDSLYADFTMSEDTVCVGQQIAFNANATGPQPISYLWSFGDGAIATTSSTTHFYNSNGTYSVTLIVSSPGSCTDTVEKTVYVGNRLPDSFAVAICEDSSFLFGTQIIDSAGIYTAHFTTVAGCDSTVILAVSTIPSPQVSFFYTQETNTPVAFTNTSVGAASFLWEFGDGATSTEKNPEHQYVQTGSYMVCLTGWNDEGCMQKTCKSIFVEVFLVLDVPTGFSPNGDGNNDILFARGAGIIDFSMAIYNRWGQKIFESNDINHGWDGTYKGKALDMESVAYVVNAIFVDGSTLQKQGNITILK